MIDADDLNPKEFKMAKAVWVDAFRDPFRDLLVEYASKQGQSPFLVLANEINVLWWLLAKEKVDNRERARTEAVAEKWLAERRYGLGITLEEYEGPSLSIYCEYGHRN